MRSFLLKLILLCCIASCVSAQQKVHEVWAPLTVLSSFTLTSNVQGRISKVYVKSNQKVSSNITLLSVTDPVLDEKLSLLKNRYESALITLTKQEKLFKKNKIDYSEYLYARNQLNESAQNYYEFLKKHDQKVSLDQIVKIKKVFVRTGQDIYYGMPLFEMIPGSTYRLTIKLPFEFLKKLGINKKVVLKDEHDQSFIGAVESLDIRGKDFFVMIKVSHEQLKENQKLKLTIQ